MSTPAPAAKTQAVATRPTDAAKEFLKSPAFLNELKVASAKVSPEAIARMVLTAAIKAPKVALAFTTPEGRASVALATITATQRGIPLDGVHGHLVPFEISVPGKGKIPTVQFMPGYQGLIRVAYNHPMVKAIWAEVVYENDEFEEVLGTDPKIHHRRTEADDPGPLRYAYACCRLDNGAVVSKVLNRSFIKRIRASSKSAAGEDSPWKTWEDQMWMKTAIKQLCKVIPQSEELRAALSDDDELETKVADASTGTIKSARPMNPFDKQPGQTIDAETGAVDAGTTTKAPTAAFKLGELVVSIGKTFDDFVKVAIDKDWLHDSFEGTSFDEVPEPVAKNLVSNWEKTKAELLV